MNVYSLSSLKKKKKKVVSFFSYKAYSLSKKKKIRIIYQS